MILVPVGVRFPDIALEIPDYWWWDGSSIAVQFDGVQQDGVAVMSYAEEIADRDQFSRWRER
jgi:hypothetical protein